jgi:GH35 family endo-1,4-beta-xylanase
MTFARRLTLLAAAIALWAATPAVAAEQPSEEDLLASAEGRIREHRMADLTVAVVDAQGKPVPGAKVVIEQTRHAFLFGSNIFKWGTLPNEEMERAYRRQFAELLNFATLGFYWPMYEPRRGQPIHEQTQRVARWCKENHIATKGHPLAWNYSDPRWLPEDLDEIRRLQMARIEDCVGRFPGLIDRWDVVNEATHFERSAFLEQAPKHTAMWQKAGRMEFTRECFAHARKAGPQATLLINDYRVDPAYERVIEQLVDGDGRPMYDVIGIQSHMHGGTWTNAKIWDVCQRFARFHVPLHFTETTVVSGQRGGRPQDAPWETTPEGEAQQAREVARFYTMLFSHPAVEAITWWDFSDYQAWQQAPAGLVRKDMSPKPAYDELKKLIKGRWWTTAEVATGDDGAVTTRGFLGDYRIRAFLAEKQLADTTFRLAKGDANRVQITP